MEMPTVAPDLGLVGNKALPDEVYHKLVDMLSWGSLEPDARLSIEVLSKMLGVSSTPVREALARLEATGLVRRTARIGYRVSPLMSKDQMRELLDARLVLETGAIERAMGRVDELLPDLEAAYAKHRTSTELLRAADPAKRPELLRQYFEDDWSFHEAILRHCGNRYIAQGVDALSFRVHRMRQTIGAGTDDAPLALAEHGKILDAVRTGDRVAAVAAMRAHLADLQSRVDHNHQN